MEKPSPSKATVGFGAMSPEEYIESRVNQYCDWYDRKSSHCKKNYQQMRAFVVIAGAVVPVVVNLSIPYREAIVTILSLCVTIVVGLESVYHYREQWKNYRSTEQYLQKEKLCFLTGDGAYKNHGSHEAFISFVERVEAAIEAENASTLNSLTLAPQPKSVTATPGKAQQGG